MDPPELVGRAAEHLVRVLELHDEAGLPEHVRVALVAHRRGVGVEPILDVLVGGRFQRLVQPTGTPERLDGHQTELGRRVPPVLLPEVRVNIAGTERRSELRPDPILIRVEAGHELTDLVDPELPLVGSLEDDPRRRARVNLGEHGRHRVDGGLAGRCHDGLQ